MAQELYLDNHSATRLCGPALEKMRASLEEYWAAGFQPYKLAQDSLSALDVRYQMIYDFVGASPEDTFIFTSSGAEAVNQVHWTAYLEKARGEGKCHFITSSVEDAPTLQSLKRLEDLGCFVKLLPLQSNGQIDLNALKSLIGPRTAMISLSLAHGLSGVIQPIEEIAAIAKEHNILLHLDATYALGKVYAPFQDLGVDYLTFSGDRLHGPKGSGGLFVKANRPLSPLITGGVEQSGYRGGSLDIPSFMGLAAAASQAALATDLMSLETARLRDLLEQEIQARIPDAQILFTDHRLPNVTVIAFPFVHQEALHYALQRKQLYASIGGQYNPHLSRHLLSAGFNETVAETAIHFSLSRNTTQEEIERAAILIAETVQTLRLYSKDLFA